MAGYIRTKTMHEGGPFLCYNCGKQLLLGVTGSMYKLKMMCPRCKANINIEMKEPLQSKNDHPLKQKGRYVKAHG